MERLPDWARRGRGLWRWSGAERPAFALAPGAGQESVWDYPRPPRVQRDARSVEVSLGGVRIAATASALRVLETASPPAFYLPPDDVDLSRLTRGQGISHCEWKGEAVYWDVAAGGLKRTRAAWSYPQPFPGFEALRDHLAFYPAVLECRVDGERVRPQPGGFYGGWVTSELTGPFKGEAGSEGW